MVVKVIKKPEPKQVMCSKCGCILEYDYTDISKKATYDYTGPSGLMNFIICLECKNEVKV